MRHRANFFTDFVNFSQTGRAELPTGSHSKCHQPSPIASRSATDDVCTMAMTAATRNLNTVRGFRFDRCPVRPQSMLT